MLVSISQKIKKLRDEKGYSLEELSKLSNLTTSTLSAFERGKTKPGYDSLRALIQAFRVTADYLLSDSSESPHSFTVTEFKNIPIYGEIYAGKEMLTRGRDNDYLNLPKEIIAKEGDVFAMTVKDDSMNGEGFLNGSYVLIRKQEIAKNGDNIIAVVDDKILIRKFYKKNDRIILTPAPANKSWEPIIFDLAVDFKIVGKVIGVYAKFK